MSEQQTEVMALLQRMQQQLTYLEKKLDTLIQQSQQKPFNRDNPQRPFRPFGRPNRPDQGPGQSYGQGHGHGGHGHYAKKKPYFGRGKEGPR